MLREWTGELEKNVFITDWISSAPKSYIHATTSGKEIMKVFGPTLNDENPKLNL